MPYDPRRIARQIERIDRQIAVAQWGSLMALVALGALALINAAARNWGQALYDVALLAATVWVQRWLVRRSDRRLAKLKAGLEAMTHADEP